MLEISSYRLELDALRQKLCDAWSKNPLPIDEIAKINQRLRVVLAQMPDESYSLYQDPSDRSRKYNRQREQDKLDCGVLKSNGV